MVMQEMVKGLELSDDAVEKLVSSLKPDHINGRLSYPEKDQKSAEQLHKESLSFTFTKIMM